MAYGYMGKTRMKALAGAMFIGLVTLASAAHAGTTLVGGGATLPALGYGGDVTHRQITPTSSSFLGVFSAQAGNPQTSYCQTGSGAGKNILAGVSGTSVQNACPDGSATPTGFGAAAVGRTDLTQPNFAGADSPLSATDYSNYTTNRTTSKPVQFPAVAGAVAIQFNKANVSSLALTDALVCKIFSGQITDWSDSQLAAAGVPAGVSGAINVVYRSDGSGTTFAFSNHLAAVCGGSSSAHFITDQAFTKVVSLYKPTIPTGWIGQSGNANVASTIGATDGTIGYAEAANVNNVANALFATVNGRDPFADFADANGKVTISSSALLYNQVITGANATTGVATTAAISPAPTTQCVVLVNPAAYATQPSTSYPIVAVSYLLGNSNGNGTDAANVRSLLGAPYNTTITGNVNLTSIGLGTGLGFLNAGYDSNKKDIPLIAQTAINGCIVN